LIHFFSSDTGKRFFSAIVILVENRIRINRTLLEKILPDLDENFFSILRLKKGTTCVYVVVRYFVYYTPVTGSETRTVHQATFTINWHPLSQSKNIFFPFGVSAFDNHCCANRGNYVRIILKAAALLPWRYSCEVATFCRGDST